MTQPSNDAFLGSHALRPDIETWIGRSAENDIAFANATAVSRRHAALKRDGAGVWHIRDNASTNGTFVNGRRVTGDVALADGDEVTVGADGPMLRFALIPAVVPQASVPKADAPKTDPPKVDPPKSDVPKPERKPQGAPARPGGQVAPPVKPSVTFSEMLPFLSRDRTLTWRNPYFVPGLVSIVVLLLLLVLSGTQGDDLATALSSHVNLDRATRLALVGDSIAAATHFNQLLGMYLTVALYFTVAKVTGRSKPWWFALATAAFTIIVLASPIWELLAFLFKDVLPGEVDLSDPFSIGKFFHTFVGIGLLEEFVKALPLFLIVFLAPKMRPGLRAKIGIHDQLDGIVVAAASACGFLFFETIGQYVGGQFTGVWNALAQPDADPIQIAAMAGIIETSALQTLLFRILSEIVGHIAYSGFFGYSIGLAVLHRKHFWRIVGIGWLVSATLHTMWDSMIVMGPVVQLIVGVAALFVLLAAIRRARRATGLSVPLAARVAS